MMLRTILVSCLLLSTPVLAHHQPAHIVICEPGKNIAPAPGVACQPAVTDLSRPGATPPPPPPVETAEEPSGRWLSLAFFFGLAVLGVWRWRRR